MFVYDGWPGSMNRAIIQKRMPFFRAMAWVQPPENTHASLVEAINRLDGAEFDLRLTSDDRLIIHHDNQVSVPEDLLEGRSPWVEHWTHDELVGLGFASFEKMMSDKEWLIPWQEHSKAVCLEIKRPHPKVAKNPHNNMSRVMQLASEMIDEAGIPETSAVFYAFHRGMDKVASDSGSTRPWSRLLPLVPRLGSHHGMRLRAFPEFVLNSFARLMKKQQKAGSPMMPCAIDYFSTWSRFAHIGLPVGLHGAAKKRLMRIKGDYPVYVWPGPLHFERALIEAGCSVLTDNAKPGLVLPDGALRWNRPATMPLTDEQWQGLAKGELPEDVTPWHEISDETLPWNVARMIGHRGLGKTSRPVLNSNA
jgi:hypothetical protein